MRLIIHIMEKWNYFYLFLIDSFFSFFQALACSFSKSVVSEALQKFLLFATWKNLFCQQKCSSFSSVFAWRLGSSG